MLNRFLKVKSWSNGHSSPTGHRDESPSTTTTNRFDKSSTFSIHSQCSPISSSTSAILRTSRTNEKNTCDQRGDSSLDDNAPIEEIRLEDNGDEESDFIDESRSSIDRCKGSQVQSVRYVVTMFSRVEVWLTRLGRYILVDETHRRLHRRALWWNGFWRRLGCTKEMRNARRIAPIEWTMRPSARGTCISRRGSKRRITSKVGISI